MATIKFLYRSSKDEAYLTLRLRHHITYPDGSTKNCHADIKTDVKVKERLYKSKNYEENDLNEDTSNKLKKIKKHIIDAIENKKDKYFAPDKQWLQNTYNDFRNISVDSPNTLLEWIDKYVEHIKTHERSKNRIKAFSTYKETIKRFDAKIEMHELSSKKLDNIYSHLLDKELYKRSTAKRMMDDILLVGKHAISREANLPDSFLVWSVPTLTKSKTSKTKLKPVILTVDEIDAIYNLELHKPYLRNARDWIILAIYTAQRGQDLMKHIVKENFFTKGDELLIRFYQGKTGHYMEIPALKRVREIYNSDHYPHPISLAKFNKYIKEVCKIAGIDTEIEHDKIQMIDVGGKKRRRKMRVKAKKYEFITAHTFRRSFCTMYFGKMPNQEIMSMSGHKTINEFLKYIGETERDHSAWKDE